MLSVASCATGDDDPPATNDAGEPIDENAVCREAMTQANNDRRSIEGAFTWPCITDDDCALSMGSVSCSDGRRASTGEFAYATVHAEEVDAIRSVHAETLCASECRLGFHLDTFLIDTYCREGACHGTDRDIENYCAGGLARIREAVDDGDLEVGCSSVADCTLVDTRITCDETGHVYGGCTAAVVVGNEAALEERLRLGTDTYCKEMGFVCTVEEPGCTAVEATCEASRCKTKPLRVIAD